MADTIPLLGSKGKPVNLLVTQRADLTPKYVAYKKGDGSPKDLTGCLFVAEIRKTPDAPALAANIEFVITDAANGKFHFFLDAASTAGLLADPEDELQPESIYVWDCKIKFPGVGGETRQLFYGNVYVFRTVSLGAPA